MNVTAGDKLHTPDCVSGEFLTSRCTDCGRDWECYRRYEDFVCDDCLPPTPEIEHPRIPDDR